MLLDLDKIRGDKIAVLDSNHNWLSYQDIISLSEKTRDEIGTRNVVLTLTRNDADSVGRVMALILSGNVPLIVSAAIEPHLLSDYLNLYKPQYISSPGNISSRTQWPEYEIHPELSHLLPTSGSTGSPKLVRHKYDNIEAAALNISTFFKLDENESPLLVLPLHFTMGLSVVFSHFKVGATVLVTDLPMTDPQFWKFIKEEKPTSFTGVPFSYEVLDRLRFTRMDLPFIKVLTQGGGKMPESLNRKFVEYCIEKGKQWIATYGQSEGTARMAWLPPEYALSKLGSIGIAVPNGKLSLRDENGNEITESPASGEMCYRGKNVTMGYAASIEDLAKGDERHGFLATGDIAYRDADGFYYVKGRMGRFLKIFGNRIGLDECEEIVKKAAQCECACSGSDELLVVYITDPEKSVIVREALVHSTHLPSNVFEIRHVDALPKNEAGKVLYKELENLTNEQYRKI